MEKDMMKNNNVIYELIYGNGKVIEYGVDWEEISDTKYKSIFEGEYLNGEKNGKGKEYYYNGFNLILIFEGEYLKGKRNGKGKEYYSNGKLKFEGEYLNGKRNRKGKEYNNKDELIFEGECRN